MRRTLAVSSIALMAATGAKADPWSVLVIGTGGEAVSVSSALSSAGVADVRHLMDGTARDIVDAVGGMAGNDRVLVYYEGALASRGGQPAIGDDPRLTMAALADRLAAEGASEVAILIENCSTAAGAEIAPPVGSLRADVLLAASAGPGQGCEGPTLTAALIGASLGTPLEQIVSGAWVGVSPRGSFSLDPGAGAPSSAIAMLEPRPEGTTLAAPLGDEAIQSAVFTPLPDSQIAAIPVAAGMPQPSIIVGITLLSGGLEGYLLGVGMVRPWMRLPLAAAGFAFSFPGLMTTLIGGLASAVIVALIWRDNTKPDQAVA